MAFLLTLRYQRKWKIVEGALFNQSLTTRGFRLVRHLNSLLEKSKPARIRQKESCLHEDYQVQVLTRNTYLALKSQI